MIKQHQQDRWAKIPGSLGYIFKRGLQLNVYDADDLSKGPIKKNYQFDLERKLDNLTYMPTQSVVDYQEKFNYT